jgi:hypothetical protein
MACPVAFYRLMTTADQISRARPRSERHPVGAVDGEEFREPRARAIDPALDRAYRALTDRSRLLVGETQRAFDLTTPLAVFRAEQVAEDAAE